MAQKSSLLLLLLIAWVAGIAQSNQLFSKLKIDHWDSKTGMPNDLNLNVYQTKDGFLWLTGYSGLIRFDGINFTTFNSRTDSIFKTDNIESILAESEDSTFWIPTPTSGLISYKNGVFKTYLADRFSGRLVGKTTSDELLITLGRRTNQYILFNTKSKKHSELTAIDLRELVNKDKFILNHKKDQNGNSWIIRDAKLLRIKNGITYELSEKEGVKKNAIYNAFYVDSKNRVWLPSSDGLLIWNGKSMVPFPGLEKTPIFPSNATTGLILEDHQGIIWVATRNGLAYLEPGSQKFELSPKNSILPLQSFSSILADKENNIWLSSETGLYKISRSKFHNYSIQDGLSQKRVEGVVALDSNRYLFVSNRTLYVIENGIIKPYPFKNKVLAKEPMTAFHIVKSSNETVWLCSAFGKLIKIDKYGESFYAFADINSAIRYAFEDQEKKMWFGFPYVGIASLNEKGKFVFLNFPKIDFKNLYLSSIRKLKNGTWVITSYNKGLTLIDKLGNPIQIEDPLNFNTVGCFNSYEDSAGTIWAVSQSGILRYKNGKLDFLNHKDGLPENSLFDFIPDQNGSIWLTSNRGLIRVLKKELDNYLDKKIAKINWQLYDDGDGMENRQCVGARHSTISPDGKLLFVTIGGLVVVDPNKLLKNSIPPSVVIHSIMRDDQSIDLNNKLLFGPGNHRYIFNYTALSFVAPTKVKFKCKLIGYDKDWINSVGERRAIYTNIPAGKYTFQVIACNNDGVWNEIGASLPFTIDTFFYETIWFRTLAIMVFFLLIWVFVKWKTRATLKKNEQLETQVAARTKDLSNTIGELKSTQSQLIQSEKMASLGELTAGIAHEIQNPLNFVNNFSEVNTELIEELKSELQAGNSTEAIALANDIAENEQKINHHGKRADSIVKGMLQHSRSSNGIKEPTDINGLADEYFRLAYHGLRAKDKSFNANLVTDFDSSIGLIPIIPQDIGRVILNLITNAFYAVNEKNEQEKESAVKFEPTVTVATKRIIKQLTGNKALTEVIQIIIKDNGNGIPKKVLDKIFQPFFTTKPTGQGTGLGLSMSYDIIKAHGGELKVETVEEVQLKGSEDQHSGTIFIVELPIGNSSSSNS